jgi:hypothetical protein
MLISVFSFPRHLSLRMLRSMLFLLSGFLLLHSPLAETVAQGDLVITPRRIVFEGSKRSQEINLANSGKDTARYIVSIVQIRMKEDGAFEWITKPDPGQYFSDKNLRFYPRTVVLAPNESQTIKIETVNTGRLTPGEYRSHIYFRAEPRDKPLGEDGTGKDTSSFSIQLVPVFGITIPVIIRVGKPTASVAISDFSVEPITDSTYRAKFTLTRTGNMSVYGDIKLFHVTPDGQSSQVGFIGGLAVYTPGEVRRCNFELRSASRVNFHTGKLRMEYLPQSDIKTGIMAQAEIPLH